MSLGKPTASRPSSFRKTGDFLRWIHAEFYKRMPEEFRVVRGDAGEVDQVTRGEFRTRQVKVGRHEPPLARDLPSFLERFDREYSLSRLTRATERMVAAAASHHFLDGNGRVRSPRGSARCRRAGQRTRRPRWTER